MTLPKISDEALMEKACSKKGCTNFAESSYNVCVVHMEYHAAPLPKEWAERKLQIEAQENA